jgi:hypothetical protein
MTFPSMDSLRERILGFERYYKAYAQPFKWKLTHRALESLLNKLNRPYAYAAA